MPYGEKRQQEITFQLPERCDGERWLNLTLSASKANQQRFHETNRLGAIGTVPAPKLVVSPRVIEIGPIRASDSPQWHVLRLFNLGGGRSEKWSLDSTPEAFRFNLTSGNLRGEQEIYFQINAEELSPGEHRREIRITGENSTSDVATVCFEVTH